MFNDDSKEGAAAADDEFSKSAGANKGVLVYTYSKPTDGAGNFQKLADYVGFDASATPGVMIITSTAGGELVKYGYTEAVTEANLNAYVAKY